MGGLVRLGLAAALTFAGAVRPAAAASPGGRAEEPAEVARYRQDLRERAAVQCELGVRMRRIDLLEGCTSDLVLCAPEDPMTIWYRWSLAVLKGSSDEARRLIERAQALGASTETI